jgi:hypothetical protein
MPSREQVAEKVNKTLLEEGAGPDSELHSWRCEYPDRYGPCDCVGEAAREVADALMPLFEQAVEQAFEQAFEQAVEQARNEALEEAAVAIEAGAKVETWPSVVSGYDRAIRIVRALKTGGGA